MRLFSKSLLAFLCSLPMPSERLFCMWLLNFDSVTHAGAKASHLPPSFDRFLLSLFFFLKLKAKLPWQLNVTLASRKGSFGVKCLLMAVWPSRAVLPQLQ